MKVVGTGGGGLTFGDEISSGINRFRIIEWSNMNRVILSQQSSPHLTPSNNHRLKSTFSPARPRKRRKTQAITRTNISLRCNPCANLMVLSLNLPFSFARDLIRTERGFARVFRKRLSGRRERHDGVNTSTSQRVPDLAAVILEHGGNTYLPILMEACRPKRTIEGGISVEVGRVHQNERLKAHHFAAAVSYQVTRRVSQSNGIEEQYEGAEVDGMLETFLG